ncbi:MAG: hypothetical protein ACR2MG_18425 [Pyrinomonadaceae bacterium]
MPLSFNTEAKSVLRTNWAKAILSFLHETTGKKLFYLGLPSEEALDIQEWLEHLDIIYAFKCREYPKMSDESQSREKVLALDDLLRELNRQKRIRNFEVFDGYIEEVVLRGYDNSPTPKEFLQYDTVTVYNLDYCNSITSPLEFTDNVGDVKTAYKFEAVKKLMEMQAALPFPSKKFVLFLTIHCSFNDANTSSFQGNPPDEKIKDYFNKINSLTKGGKAPYLLKAFVFYNLSQFFLANNFLPEFLPVTHYIGNGNKPLLFFTVLGTQIEAKAGIPTSLQRANEFLTRSFLSIEKNNFTNNTNLLAHGEIEWQNTNPLVLFKNSKTYQRYWG